MARRSGGGRSPAMGRGRSPSPMAARRPAPAPAQRQVAPAPAAATPAVAPQPAMASPGGGMMANIASTAAGVAIGHTVGHAITGALMGGNNHSEPAVTEQGSVQPMQQQQQQQPQQAYNQEPCKFELDQFLNCSQTQNDLSLCDGFNQVLRECKLRYGGEQHQRMY